MARLFDASNNDFLDAGNPSTLNLTGDEVTLSAWIRPASFTAEMKFFAKWTVGQFQYLLSVNTSDVPIFAIFNGGTNIAEGSTTLSTDVWYHIVGTYDGTTVIVYVDGVEDGTNPTTGTMSSTSAPVRIGAGSGGSGTENPFDGDIGHCAIWDVALTADEIESLSVGINPLNIRSENRLFYAPLNGQSPELDVIDGLSLTVNGTTVSEEPPIPNSIKAP